MPNLVTMKKILFSAIIFTSAGIFAQTELVFVYFKDKPNKAAFYANPQSELSEKALARRANLGIALNDQDAPLENSYVQSIENLGFEVSDKSKWLNGVAVNANSMQIEQLESQSFVASVESFVKDPFALPHDKKKNKFEDSYSLSKEVFPYGNGASQIDQVNLRPLHVSGFTGKNISIAVLDTGFPTVDTGSAYARLRNNGKIKGVYNFISKNNDVYNTALNSHGSMCLGVIGGYIAGSFVGSAPDADFYLYATESGPLEIPEEELYWIQAAEEADRVGVDIISSSLGYGDFFDDPRYNYTYEDMNGSKSFVARGAQIAADKGILVVSANGNEGGTWWHYLITPADNADVFSVGAVTPTGNSSGFSSYGPNALGVIKPDASARGSETWFGFNNGATYANGTSFATPLTAGGIACLLQALPSSQPREEIRNSLRNTASLAPSHDDQMGFGILNFAEALEIATLSSDEATVKKNIQIYPNPVTDFVQIKTDDKIKSVELYDQLGRQIRKFNNEKTINIRQFPKGVYIMKVETEKATLTEKIIKK